MVGEYNCREVLRRYFLFIVTPTEAGSYKHRNIDPALPPGDFMRAQPSSLAEKLRSSLSNHPQQQLTHTPDSQRTAEANLVSVITSQPESLQAQTLGAYACQGQQHMQTKHRSAGAETLKPGGSGVSHDLKARAHKQKTGDFLRRRARLSS